MAAKSDFAKKLLHDLRLRKERMAASQSSNNSKTNTRDAYVDPGQTYRGSRQNKALESIGPKTSNTQRRSSRPLVNGESSNQLVNYGRIQSSQQIGDLSMALLLALENGGKFSATDSKGNRSTLGFIKPPRSSTTHFPTISPLHINDISKGVQNLNKILRACSNGVNLDNYSIQVGKELLKGAIDLEESLRMLVNLQEASEYMVPPQRKNRLTLLEEDEDDEAASSAKLVGDKQLGPPRFSFDKPSRSSQDLNHTMMALTYPTDDKQALTTSNLWARLQNCKPEMKSGSASPPAKPEKARISNVIAKLMGLEEVPQKIDSNKREKESSLKKKEGTNKNGEVKTRHTENLTPLASDKKVVIQAKKITPAPAPAPVLARARSTPIMLKVEKSRVSSSVNLDEKVPKKNYERANKANAATGTKKGTVAIDRKQNDSGQGYQILGNRKKIQENERDKESTKQKEGKRKENGESKEVVLKDERHQKVVREGTSSEAANILHQKIMKNEGTLQTEKNQEGKREQPTKKQILQDKKLDGSALKLKGPLKPVYGALGLQKKQPQGNQRVHSKPSKDLPTKTLFNDATTRKAGPIVEMQVCSNKSYRKVNEVMAKRNGINNNSARPLKDNSAIMQEQRKRRDEKVNESKGVKLLTFSRPKEVQGGGNGTNEGGVQIPDECQTRKSEYSPKSNDSVPKTNSEVCTVSNDYQEKAPTFREDSEVMSHEISPIPLSGASEGNKKNIRLYQHEHKKVSTLLIQEPLTGNEKHLKEILIKGQIFLISAEALFKLNIPINILHSTDHICRDSNTKLILDCGYEVMNRKGRIQELHVHPFVKISIGNIKLKSFDDLVKQLYKDFEWLRLWNGIDECDSAGYLHKMLERDIENKVPDLNSTWEFGWNKSMIVFEEKDDVIRDVEKQLLDGLIDEIMNDLLNGTVLV